ncbi:hypothetical protein FCR2A7T_08290 [Flavobacterium cauense R2A-7]|uniref:Molybdopterin-containing oxidoreductase family membrane subunit n=1 Tax=Flavobacterium cauense R2A-7 TaxID=1341154 RepID=V6S1H1_9FLAO|nr:hypothetical protein [Flavobacterium cauense]ESU20523.1 hypothetical protein FCR2A7T_08290 [Flavobacterium cauense R2A-7]KGO83084.1 hypothetical protein Q762_04905 [Flavobacterium cauense R2A-7]TWI10147.1 molybdopterin-containing oxidoreductase family membrane subunit [Flavobacterium cauense R2A-7]
MFSIYGVLSNLFLGFGLYNLLFLFLGFTGFRKNNFYREFDKSAIKTLLLLGLTYLAFYGYDTLLIFIDADTTNKTTYLQRLNGPYAFALFAQQFLYIIFSLAFLIPYVKRFFPLRLLFGLGLMLNFEKFTIIVTSLHRDYLPSSWTMYSTLTGSIAMDWLLSMVFFVGLSFIPYFFGLRKQSVRNM